MLARCTTITKLEAEDVTRAKPMRSDKFCSKNTHRKHMISQLQPSKIGFQRFVDTAKEELGSQDHDQLYSNAYLWCLHRDVPSVLSNLYLYLVL